MRSRTLTALAAGTLFTSFAMAQNTNALRIAPAAAGNVDVTIPWLAQAGEGWDQGLQPCPACDPKEVAVAS